ncbi:hypothetical protein [Salinibacter ruber]|uniref:Uncharacterized protein n=1 Tax=Salinibacter ruber TaxID=146919 RepID=A0A9X2U4D8_9BACT|nr:hypothetical protein [Salinibacter ruber]MCS3859798.1 hypothetical protein [Salinibacter ruber]MCS3866625.1 hypothetical protein [Salinibacter ruber]MCS4177661.1 hypothetical protein [Salinibacter ruber]
MTDLNHQNGVISDEWRQEVEIPSQNWRRADNQAGSNFDYLEGEAGGFFASVEVAGFERRAYLKPGKSRENQHRLNIAQQKARAACEKIASDLAYELGLPVPPAVLSQRSDPQDQWCEEEVVLSLVMYPRQWSWAQVKGLHGGGGEASPKDAALEKAFAECTPMLAFDTWIGQRDHEYTRHNIVWGYEPGNLKRSRLVFLDFAYSLGSSGGEDFDGEWDEGGWQPVEAAGFPSLIEDCIDRDELEMAIARIEDLPEREIRTIVDRIPTNFLPPWRAENIKEGLLGRREELRSSLSGILSN